MKALGIDGYAFSLYKVFGPHQSLLYVNSEIRNQLASQAHYFNAGTPSYDFNPAGPQHAQVAACAGVIDYFNLLHEHHFGGSQASLADKMSDLHSLIQRHENQLAAPIIKFLSNHADTQLIGKTHVDDNDRAPTIAFKPLKQSSKSLVHTLQDNGIGTENGNFYAHRLITDLGIDPDDGVVRLSLVHYNQQADVDRIVGELDRALG